MAEAAAVIGLVASIASLVKLTAKAVSQLYKFTSNSLKVPELFHSLLTSLSLLIVILKYI